MIIYTAREQKEKEYTELGEHFQRKSANVKSKTNALKAQLGMEIAKESKTKNQYNTGEQYISKCIFYDLLQFLRPVLASGKSTDNISSAESNLKCSISVMENKLPSKKTAHKKFAAKKKLEMLSNSAELMMQPHPDVKSTKMSHFSLFIEGKICRSNKQNKMFPKKGSRTSSSKSKCQLPC